MVKHTRNLKNDKITNIGFFTKNVYLYYIPFRHDENQIKIHKGFLFH